MTTSQTLTKEQKSRIKSALIETQDLLDKELTYSPDFQHIEMVEFYRNHIAKLQEMIGLYPAFNSKGERVYVTIPED